MDPKHRRQNHLLRIWQRKASTARDGILEAAARREREEAEAARRRLLDQAAVVPEPASRTYWARPLLTPGQESRGHGGRP
jgi:hypothetical protein